MPYDMGDGDIMDKCDRLEAENAKLRQYVHELKEIAEGAMASYRQECMVQGKDWNEPLEERFQRVVRGKADGCAHEWTDGGEDEHGPVDICKKCGIGGEQARLGCQKCGAPAGSLHALYCVA
jgi:hypothetical protein